MRHVNPRFSLVFSGLLAVVLGFSSADVHAEGDFSRFSRQEIRDPEMNNIVSHTLLVPDGWKLEGGVVWTPGMKPFVHNQFGVVSGDGREVWFLSGLYNSYEEIPPALMQFMQMQGQQIPPPGTPQSDGTIWQPPPRDAADYVTRQLLPQGRPTASNIRVREVERLREFEDAIAQVMGAAGASLNQAETVDPFTGIRSEQNLSIHTVSVAYQDGGREYREDFLLMLWKFRMVTPDTYGLQGGPLINYLWQGIPMVSVRAPAEVFEANESLFVTIASSMSSTPQWQARIDALQAKIAQIEHEGRMASIAEFGRSQRQIAETNREISEMQMSSWRERQDSNARMARSFSNTMLGVNDYRNPDGSSVSLPSDYNHVFTDAHGNYMMSNDPHFDPNRIDQRGGWQQIEPAR